MSDFDYRSLNNSAQTTQSREEPKDVEAYLKQELQKGVNGNPQRLKDNYDRLQEEIARKKVKLEIVARQHDGAKRAELEGQAQAKIGRLNQVLNELYFQEASSIDVQLAPLPPEPVYRGVEKPSGDTSYIGNTFFSLGMIIVFIGGCLAVFSSGSPGLLLVVIGFVILLSAPVVNAIVKTQNENKADKRKRYEKEYGEYQAQHAQWEKLKREHELLKNNSKGQDELDKYL